MGLKVLAVVVMKNYIFLDTTPCSSLNASRRFGVISRLPSSGLKNNPNKKPATSYLLHAVFLLALILDPEDGGNMFLRGVG
jgi:hypothetical protein